MEIEIEVGDILDVRVDALICSANPLLRMTGGVNGALLQRGGIEVQRELEAHLARVGRTWVPPGTVVRTGPGPLEVGCILHAVAVDGFYRSDVERVRRTLVEAFRLAAEEGATTLATPSLATGYGPLSIGDFARALSGALGACEDAAARRITWVVRKAEDAAEGRRAMRSSRKGPRGEGVPR